MKWISMHCPAMSAWPAKDEGRRPPERRVQYSEIAMNRRTGGEMGGRED